jgi:hypothetical protein
MICIVYRYSWDCGNQILNILPLCSIRKLQLKYVDVVLQQTPSPIVHLSRKIPNPLPYLADVTYEWPLINRKIVPYKYDCCTE